MKRFNTSHLLGRIVKASSVLIAFSVLLSPMTARASENEDVITDNGYNFTLTSFPDSGFIAGESAQFTTHFSYENGNPVANGKVWVHLVQDNQVVFSSSDFRVENASVDFEYFFSNPGDYDLTIRLVDSRYDDEATLKKTLTVQDNPDQVAGAVEEVQSSRRSNFNLAVLTLIIGGLGGIILSRAIPLANNKTQVNEKKPLS